MEGLQSHDGPTQDQRLPRSGPGGTDGPGTYSRYKWMNVDKVLKFDGNKQPRGRNPNATVVAV